MADEDQEEEGLTVLISMFKKDLVALAAYEGVQVDAKATKADIAAAIVEARGAGGVTSDDGDAETTAPSHDGDTVPEADDREVGEIDEAPAAAPSKEEREERENADPDAFDHHYGRAHHELFGLDFLGVTDVLWRRDAHIMVGLGLLSFAFALWFLPIDDQLLNFLTLVVALGLLVTSADFFLDGAKGLARRMGIAEIIIGLTIVSIGTSLPEILLAGQASFSAMSASNAGDPDFRSFTDLAVGNIFGSVLVQITLILGIVVLVRPLKVQASWLKRDGTIMLAAVLLLMVLVFWVGPANQLERWEGGILCALYLGYIGYLVRHRALIREEEAQQMEEASHAVKHVDLQEEKEYTTLAFIVMVVGGLALAIYSSNVMVTSASQIATKWGVSAAVIGVTVAAVGTSLPELAVGIQGALKKSQGVAMGTLVGSNITDPLLSIGIAAVIFPVSVSAGSLDIVRWVIIPFTVVAVALSLVMMASGLKFTRREGGTLVAFYVVFLVVLLVVM